LLTNRSTYLFCLFLLLGYTVFAQPEDLKKFDYSLADKTAIEFPKKKYKTVSEIAKPLTENLTTEHEQFRAIFRWITENIEYNKSAAGAADADKVVRKNKAVCQGFSNLLKEMCEAVNIPCDVVVGYTKTDPKDINRKLKKTDHAWNIVTLYGKKYLVDVTWATSKYNVVTRKFQKEFDEHYYLTPPEKFILDHLPENKKDQLLEKPISKKQFSSTPLLYTDYFHLGVASISPNKGHFKQKLSRPFTFEFTMEKGASISSAAVLVDTDQYLIPVDLKNNKLEYRFDKEGDHDIAVYLDGKAVAEYLVKVK
jgi:hypothetical protein